MTTSKTTKNLWFMTATGLAILGVILLFGPVLLGVVALVLAAICVAGGLAAVRSLKRGGIGSA